MKVSAISFLLAYHVIMRPLCDYADVLFDGFGCYTFGDVLYYFLDAIFIGVIGYYVFSHCDKTIANWGALICVMILAINQTINTTLMMLGYDAFIYLEYFLWFCVLFELGLIVKERVNRYKL